jgi:5-formyltetrahydrofolate cyclo-ligase
VDPVDASDVAAAKIALRRRRIASRAAMTDEQRATARAAVSEVVLARAASADWRCVAAYVPLRTEPGSTGLLTGLAVTGVRVLVPVTLPDRDLDWAEWSAAECGPPLGLSAVGDADAVLVPAFAVGDDGMRLGRGGGSYDRALPRCAPHAVTAALLFDGERERVVPAQQWDRPVRGVVTPSGWTQLG